MSQNYKKITTLIKVVSLTLSIPFIAASNLSASGAAFDLRYTIQALDTNGDPHNISNQMLNAIAAAKAELEGMITSYQDGMIGTTSIGTVEITVIHHHGIFAGANDYTAVTDNSNFSLRTGGSFRFNADALYFSDDPTRFDRQKSTILHESLHILGIGSADGITGGWVANGLYDINSPDLIDPNTLEVVGAYTGANALAAYQTEFNQPDATYVPVSRTTSPHSHWHQADGVPNGVVSVISGLDFSEEMVTPYTSQNAFLSNVTRGSLIDMGFNVQLQPIPEPSSSALLGLGGLALIMRRRR
jgi:hypothetical protein